MASRCGRCTFAVFLGVLVWGLLAPPAAAQEFDVTIDASALDCEWVDATDYPGNWTPGDVPTLSLSGYRATASTSRSTPTARSTTTPRSTVL